VVLRGAGRWQRARGSHTAKASVVRCQQRLEPASHVLLLLLVLLVLLMLLLLLVLLLLLLLLLLLVRVLADPHGVAACVHGCCRGGGRCCSCRWRARAALRRLHGGRCRNEPGHRDIAGQVLLEEVKHHHL
jgi:hypothetical protein